MNVLIFGATGSIGNAVVAESLRQGHETIAAIRSMNRDCDFHGA